MGLPGFSGFVAELQVLIGAWTAFPVLAVLAGVGILVGIAYMIRTIAAVVLFGRSRGTRRNAARRDGATVGSHYVAGALRRGDPDGDHAADRIVSAALVADDCAQFEFAVNGQSPERSRTMSFFELLVLLVPEALVLVTGLVVLAVDLAEMRHKSLPARLLVASIITTVGCLVAILWLAQAYSPHQTKIMDGLLVIDPMVLLVKQVILVLTIFTGLLSRESRLYRARWANISSCCCWLRWG